MFFNIGTLKTPVFESHLYKVVKKRLQYRCCLVHLAKLVTASEGTVIENSFPSSH